MKDIRISGKTVKFVHEEVELDNRPHVKVDDGVPASRCERIYFGIDHHRIVVDIVGLHDRS